MKIMIQSFNFNDSIDHSVPFDAALKILLNFSNGNLPVNLSEIINSIDNLNIKTYSWFQKKHNLTFREVLDIVDSTEGCLWMKKKNDKVSYLILYNNNAESIFEDDIKLRYQTFERIRFTIAHELGHYILRHNEQTDATFMSRYSLNPTTYKKFEVEANSFATMLLSHIQLSSDLVSKCSSIDHKDLSSFFSISYSSAEILLKRSQPGTNHWKRSIDLEKKFSRAINNLIQKKLNQNLNN